VVREAIPQGSPLFLILRYNILGKRSRQKRGRGDSLLFEEIAACRRCPRLVAYCASFQEPEQRKAPDLAYWAKPVPGFGDPNAELLVIGLAPGAHGANRTGRPFTGDAAGEVLYRALHRHGFSSLSAVSGRDDGLLLRSVYITNAVKCLPPGNRPSGEEKRVCLDWLSREMAMLKRVRVVLAMGKDAFDSYLHLLKAEGKIRALGAYRFGHGETYRFEGDPKVLLASYHFSRYNMNTGVLTEAMVEALFQQAKALLA
jgi:uracil-DNA glycosylase family 4